MERTANYKTKQREALLSYIASLDGLHVTVGQIAEHFKERENPIGVTTIYRHLDKLVEMGKVKKFMIDGISGACFQYIRGSGACREHFHLKCEDCGRIVHLQCGFLDELQRHISKELGAYIDANKTVFYGKCKSCAKRTVL